MLLFFVSLLRNIFCYVYILSCLYIFIQQNIIYRFVLNKMIYLYVGVSPCFFYTRTFNEFPNFIQFNPLRAKFSEET